MSDLSMRHCRKCREPEYACDCDDPDLMDSITNYIGRNEKVPADHPFFDQRPGARKDFGKP